MADLLRRIVDDHHPERGYSRHSQYARHNGHAELLRKSVEESGGERAQLCNFADTLCTNGR